MISRRNFIKGTIVSLFALAVPFSGANELPLWKSDLVNGIEQILKKYLYENSSKIPQLHEEICKFLEKYKTRNKIYAIYSARPVFNKEDRSLNIQVAVKRLPTIEFSMFEFKVG